MVTPGVDKTGDIPKIAEDFCGKVDALNKLLRGKYGEDLESIATQRAGCQDPQKDENTDSTHGEGNIRNDVASSGSKSRLSMRDTPLHGSAIHSPEHATPHFQPPTQLSLSLSVSPEPRVRAHRPRSSLGVAQSKMTKKRNAGEIGRGSSVPGRPRSAPPRDTDLRQGQARKGMRGNEASADSQKQMYRDISMESQMLDQSQDLSSIDGESLLSSSLRASQAQSERAYAAIRAAHATLDTDSFSADTDVCTWTPGRSARQGRSRGRRGGFVGTSSDLPELSPSPEPIGRHADTSRGMSLRRGMVPSYHCTAPGYFHDARGVASVYSDVRPDQIRAGGLVTQGHGQSGRAVYMPRGGSLRLAMINRPAPSKPKRRPSSEARRPLPGQGQSPSSLSSGNIHVFSGLVEAYDATPSSQHKLGIFSSRRNTHTEMIERELEGLARLLRLPRKLPGQSVEWYAKVLHTAVRESQNQVGGARRWPATDDISGKKQPKKHSRRPASVGISRPSVPVEAREPEDVLAGWANYVQDVMAGTHHESVLESLAAEGLSAGDLDKVDIGHMTLMQALSKAGSARREAYKVLRRLDTNAASVEAMRRTEKHSKISGARAASPSHREWYVPSGDLGKRHIVPWKPEDPSSFGTGPHRPGKGTAKKLAHRQRKEGAIQS